DGKSSATFLTFILGEVIYLLPCLPILKRHSGVGWSCDSKFVIEYFLDSFAQGCTTMDNDIQDSGTEDCINVYKEQVLNRSRDPGIIYGPNANIDELYIDVLVYTERAQHNFPKEMKRHEIYDVYKEVPQTSILLERIDELFYPNRDTKGKFPRSILVIGRPGIGKTVLTEKILHDWANGIDEYYSDKIVFFFKFRWFNKNINKLTNISLKTFLQFGTGLSDENFESIYEEIAKEPQKAILIFDGLDEYHDDPISCLDQSRIIPNDCNTGTSAINLFIKLVLDDLLKGATVVVTSRPTADDFYSRLDFDRNVEIIGFTSNKIEEYVGRFCDNNNTSDLKMKVWNHIKSSSELLNLCYIPVNCFIVCVTLSGCLGDPRNETSALPTTLTELYQTAIDHLEKHHHRNAGRNSTAHEALKQLQRLAYLGMESGQLVFNQTLFDEEMRKSGLLNSLSNPIFPLRTQFCFIHLTIQEFLAARHVTETFAPAEIKRFISDHIESGQWHLVLQFIAGLLERFKVDKGDEGLPVFMFYPARNAFCTAFKYREWIAFLEIKRPKCRPWFTAGKRFTISERKYVRTQPSMHALTTKYEFGHLQTLRASRPVLSQVMNDKLMAKPSTRSMGGTGFIGIHRNQDTPDFIAQECTTMDNDIQDSGTEDCTDVYKEQVLNRSRDPGIIYGPNADIDDLYVDVVIHTGRAQHKFLKEMNRHEIYDVYMKVPETSIRLEKIGDLFYPNRDTKGEFPRSILVIGRPGIGKTVLTEKILRDWANGVDEYYSDKIVFFFKFRWFNENINKLTNISLKTFLRFGTGLSEEKFEGIYEEIAKEPHKAVLIFDGLDEYHGDPISYLDQPRIIPNDLDTGTSPMNLFIKLVLGDLLKGATVVVTSRPTADDFYSRINFDRKVEIIGFTFDKIEEYVRRFCDNNNTINCFIVALPTTLTELYQTAIDHFEKHHHRNADRNSTAHEALKQLERLAFLGMESGQLVFDQTLFDKEMKKSGLLNSLSNPIFLLRTQFCFIHLTIQEFLAARHVTETFVPPEIKKFIFDHVECGKWHLVLQFIAGLLAKKKAWKLLMVIKVHALKDEDYES
ncbi:Hypothetical predicted protein, partial [Paramuricea clavata]